MSTLKLLPRLAKITVFGSLNKYPKFQKLIKAASNLEASQELQDLKDLYKNEPKRFLGAQIEIVNKFINSKEVQTKVSEDFDNCDFLSFDVSNGDNNCQSRIFLMYIFQQKISYNALTPGEKLLLTLSHIAKYNKEVKDEFGLLLKDVPNTNIQYGSTRLASIKAVSKIEAKAEEFYTVSDLIGMAISEVSAGFLQRVADELKNSQLKLDLAPYSRKMQNSNKLKPVQQLQAASMEAVYSCIELEKLPIAYKITRLSLTSNGKKFSLQGIALIDGDGTQINAGDKAPRIIFELYSVDTIECRKNTVTTEFGKLASADSFSDYINELQTYGIRKLINLCAVRLDKELHKPETVTYNSTNLTANAKTSEALEKCLSHCYAIGGCLRSTDGVVLSPSHIYVSCTQSELSSIQLTEEKNLVTRSSICRQNTKMLPEVPKETTPETINQNHLLSSIGYGLGALALTCGGLYCCASIYPEVKKFSIIGALVVSAAVGVYKYYESSNSKSLA